MAATGGTELTIVDAVKRMLPSGRIADIAELLHQKNGIIADIPFREGDTAGGHMSVQETSLPTIYTRVAGVGVASSKSTTSQILEAPEVLEGWSVVDEIVGHYGGDLAGKRAAEANRFTESMNQTVADRYIYGNGSTTPGQLNGFAVRCSSTSAANGSNVIKADASASGSDQMSIYLVGWNDRKVYGWYPKGMPGGLVHNDFGRVPVEANGLQRVTYKEQFQWSIGLAVDDWRYLVRICNIDKSGLIAGTGADLPDALIKATKCIPDFSGINPVFYMNRTAEAFLDLQCKADVTTGGGLTFENVDGRRITSFRGIPIKPLDRLTEAEGTVS